MYGRHTCPVLPPLMPRVTNTSCIRQIVKAKVREQHGERAQHPRIPRRSAEAQMTWRIFRTPRGRLVHLPVNLIPCAGLSGKEVDAVVIVYARLDSDSRIEVPTPGRSSRCASSFQFYGSGFEVGRNPDVGIQNHAPLITLIGAKVHHIDQTRIRLCREEPCFRTGKRRLRIVQVHDGFRNALP